MEMILIVADTIPLGSPLTVKHHEILLPVLIEVHPPELAGVEATYPGGIGR